MIQRMLDARRDAERHLEGGFTLLEVLIASVLMGIVLTLSVGALRHFWLVRALSGGTESVVTQLRSTQENAVSESYPVVYGVRFDVGTRNWYVLRYDPMNAGAGDDTCTITERYSLESGVEIKTAAFMADAGITNFCKGTTAAPATAALAFFYPRGNATSGQLVLEHSGIGQTRTVSVAALTGRVTEE